MTKTDDALQQAAGGSAEARALRERYVTDLSRGEDRIAQCRADSKGMRENKGRLEQELRSRLAGLKFETAV